MYNENDIICIDMGSSRIRICIKISNQLKKNTHSIGCLHFRVEELSIL